MVLTTRGRRTGRVRQTPLWYVRKGNIIYCFSGWGASSDWFKNLEASPDVRVQIGKQRWEMRAALVEDPSELGRILESFFEKYGRLVPVFYHLDRLRLLAFSHERAKGMSGE